MFSMWGIARYQSATLPGIGIGPDEIYNTFSHWASWVPLAQELSNGILLPVTPSLGIENQGLSYYPYISLWVHGVLLFFLGAENATLVGSIFFPLLCFIVLARIYMTYLPGRWSFGLAAFGTVSLTSLPLRVFLGKLLSGEGWRQAGVDSPLDICHFPNPAFSLLCFLCVFYLTMRWKKISWTYTTVLTVLWSLQTQIHLSNAIFGLPLWFLWLYLRLWRAKRYSPNWLQILAVQTAIAVIATLPMTLTQTIILWQQGFGFELMTINELVSINAVKANSFFNAYYYLIYFILPLIALTFVWLIIRIDPYEVLTKFSVIFLAMFIEVLFVSLANFIGFSIIAELIFLRLSLYFFHILYYIPAVYYLCRQNRDDYSVGTEGSQISKSLRIFFRSITYTGSFYYIPVLFFILTLLVLSNASKTMEESEKYASIMAKDREVLALLTKDAKPKDLLVSNRMAVNLMLPVKGKFETLWVNRFTNRISEDNAIERLILFSKLVGWNQKQFLRFMLPTLENPLAMGRKVYLPAETPPPALGYWLVKHKQKMSKSNLDLFQSKLMVKYSSFKVLETIKKLRVRKVLTRKILPHELINASVNTPFGVLYELKL